MAKYADANGLSHAFTVIKNALAGKADSSHTHDGLVPSGGSAGQFLTKSSATDYDMEWTAASGGGGRCAFYGTSSTAATAAAKVITCSGFALEAGNIVVVKFANGNTYNGEFTLNVNGTGDKAVYVGNSVANATNNTLKWSSGAIVCFMYDGTLWRYLSSMAAATTQQPDGAGAWYCTCSTDAATRDKVITVSNFRLTRGALIVVNASTANTYTANSVRLNVNGTGAKAVYKDGAATSTTNTLTWAAGTLLFFMYSGSYFYYLGSDMDGGGSYTLPTASDAVKGGVKINLDDFWMDGEVLTLSMRWFFFDITSTTFAALYDALAAGKIPYTLDWQVDSGGNYLLRAHIVKDVYLDDSGGVGDRALTLWYDVYDTSTWSLETMEATVLETDDSWAVDTAPKGTNTTVDVSITIPSTGAGTNAANLTGTATLSGYRAVGIAGWKWASGTRQNFFNFYRLDVNDSGTVTVSACNLHGSQAAQGVLTVHVLMERE